MTGNRALIIRVENKYAEMIREHGGDKPGPFLNKILLDLFAKGDVPAVGRREGITKETHKSIHPTFSEEVLKKMEGISGAYKCVAAYVEMALDNFKGIETIDIAQLRHGNEILLNGEVVTVDYQRKGKVYLIGHQKCYGRFDVRGWPLSIDHGFAFKRHYEDWGATDWYYIDKAMEYRVNFNTGEIVGDCQIKTVTYWHELQNFITDFCR